MARWRTQLRRALLVALSLAAVPEAGAESVTVVRTVRHWSPDFQDTGHDAALVERRLSARRTNHKPKHKPKNENKTRSREVAQASVEVYYLTTCPHCASFLNEAVLPMIEAKLPDDQVEVAVLPVLKGMSSPKQCMSTSACRFALAPLCALRGAFPLPATGASKALRDGTRFAACDVNNTVSGQGGNQKKTKECAEKAGLHWGGEGGLRECAQGPEAFGVMYSPDYANKVIAAMHRLRQQKWKEPPGMPWIFLNGELLDCRVDGDMRCVAVKRPGKLAHKEPRDLLEMVCARLDPQPEGCRGAAGGQSDSHSARPSGNESVQHGGCETCDEVGIYRWRRGSSWSPFGQTWLTLTCGVAACALFVGRILACRMQSHREPCRTPSASPLTPPAFVRALRSRAATTLSGDLMRYSPYELPPL